jgi:hypothetical protein
MTIKCIQFNSPAILIYELLLGHINILFLCVVLCDIKYSYYFFDVVYWCRAFNFEILVLQF